MCKYIANLPLMTYNNGLNCEREVENSLTTSLTQIGFKKSFFVRINFNLNLEMCQETNILAYFKWIRAEKF